MNKKFILSVAVAFLSTTVVFSQCPTNSINSDVSITDDTTWAAGIYNINGDFLINPNVTLTVSGYNGCPFTINADNISVYGTINANGAGGAGGTGGIAGTTAASGGTAEPGGGGGGSSGSGTGGGTGGNTGTDATGGCAINCGTFCLGGNDADRGGGGGGSGGAGGSFGATAGAGGAGANGRFENEPSNSDCGSTPVAGSGGAAPTAATPYDNTNDSADVQAGSGGGGGGGGGGGYSAGTVGGSGGNGGGAVNLNAGGNLLVSGIILANGTDGGVGGNGGVRSGNASNWNCETCSNGDGGGSNDCRDGTVCTLCTYFAWVWPGGGGGGAGGGSGGGIKLLSLGVMTITGALQANGGNGGNAGHPWQSDAACNNYAGGGGAGAGGVIKYVYNPCANNVFTPSTLSVVAGTPGNGTDGNVGSNTAGNGVVFDQTADIYYPGYQPFTAPAITSNQSTCEGGQINGLNSTPVSGGTGSYNYQWYYSKSNPIGQLGSAPNPAANWYSIPNAIAPSLSGDSIGSLTTTTYYQLQVQSGPCYIWSNVVTITILPSPAISNVSVTDVICSYDSNGSITVFASGGTPGYTYSDDSGATYQSTNVFSGLDVGSYDLFVQDANNCTAAYALNAVEVSASTVIVQTDLVQNATCIGLHNGSIHVTASGGTSPYYYSLNGGGSQESNAFTSMAGAIYYVRVLDSKGCYNTQMVTVEDSLHLNTVVDSVSQVTCFGKSNGAITIETSGGTAPYMYAINGGLYQSSTTFTGLASGNYSVSLHDQRGCTGEYDFAISQPDSLILRLDTVINGACSGSNVDVSIAGGTEPYRFVWNNGDSTRNLLNLNSGTYSLTASDANNCSSTLSANVQTNMPFTVLTSSTSASCFNQADGSASVTVTGNSAPYTFTWDNGGADSIITNLNAGNYQVTVSDANNCTQSYAVSILQPGPLTTAFDSTQPECGGETNGALGVAVYGGTPPYTFAWSNGSTGDSISQLAAGIYMLTVTDSMQCTTVTSVALPQPAPITTTILVYGASSGGANGSAVIDSIWGGVPPYSIQWSSGQTDTVAGNLASGLDTVVITDRNGCTKTEVVVIGVTGINPTIELINFSIYPNPAKSVLMIDIFQLQAESVITMRNVLGETVISKNITSSHNEIDISNLAEGLYLVELTQGDKRAARQIVIAR